MIILMVFGFIAGTVLFLTVHAQGAKVINGANDVFKGMLPCNVDIDGDGLIQNDLCPCGPTFYEVSKESLHKQNSFFRDKVNTVALTKVSVNDVARLEKFLTGLKENPPKKGQKRTVYVSKELTPYLKTTTPQQSNFCFDRGNCSVNQFKLDYFTLGDNGHYKKICNVSTADCQKQINKACAINKDKDNTKKKKS